MKTTDKATRNLYRAINATGDAAGVMSVARDILERDKSLQDDQREIIQKLINSLEETGLVAYDSALCYSSAYSKWLFMRNRLDAGIPKFLRKFVLR